MPKRNIFVVLNVSNDSNFNSDSGYVFQKLLWKKLTKLDHQVNVFFLGHKKIKDFWGNRITIIPFFDRFDKYSTRINFDWHGLREILRQFPQMDLIINNQPEHTLALKILLASEYNHKVPIISYYHYLPFHYKNSDIVFDESQNLHGFAASHIMGRNLEAMEISDLNLIGSKFGKKICKKAFQDHYRRRLQQPFEVLTPPIEDELFQIKNDKRNRIVRILYNQRLYKHYGTLEILDLLDELSSKKKFKLIVTNPTAKRSAERNRLDPNVNGIKAKLASLSFVQIVECPTRKAYHKLLSSIDFAIGPLKPSALWSMAVTDVLASGKPVLCPDMAAFPEIVHNSPDLLFTGRKDFKTKFKGFFKKDTTNFNTDKLRSYVEKYRETRTAQKMLQLINSL